MIRKIYKELNCIDTSKSLALLLLAFLFITTSQAQHFNQTTKLTPTSPSKSALFGYTVALSGDYAMVGAHQEDRDANNQNFMNLAGAVYVFKRDKNDSWKEVQKIVHSDRSEGDYFGYSAAMSGNYAMVGSFRDKDDNEGKRLEDAGAVYFYELDESSGMWKEVQKVIPPARFKSSHFGGQVAMDGNYAVISAEWENDISDPENPIKYSGAVYVYKRNNNGKWIFIQKFINPGKETWDRYGSSVAISGKYFVVGASNFSKQSYGGAFKENSTGQAYMYKMDSEGKWTFAQKLIASDLSKDDLFGYTVDISGTYVIVGAFRADEDVNGRDSLRNAGAAYIFEQTKDGKWNQVQKIVAADRDKYDSFGNCVTISGKFAVIGAATEIYHVNDELDLPEAGAAYIFERSCGKWNQLQEITASKPIRLSNFGLALDINGKNIIIGAHLTPKNKDMIQAGAAYIFKGKINSNPCPPAAKPVVNANNKTICKGESVSLSVIQGQLNGSKDWQWYTSSCGGRRIGNGIELTITPTKTTTYYVHGEGGIGNGPCTSITITVQPSPFLGGVPVANNSNKLLANIEAETYQWIDCNNGNQLIPNETNKNFSPKKDGSYAVQVTKGGCVAQSDCVTVQGLSRSIFNTNICVSVISTQTADVYRIEFGAATKKDTKIELFNEQGQLVSNKEIQEGSTNHQLNLSSYSKGKYKLRISTPNWGMATFLSKI